MSVETKEEGSNIKLEEEIQKLSSVEEKLKLVLDKMKQTLVDEKHANFKLFWEARHLCLKLFKENLHPSVRFQMWQSFIELSKQAKGLKDLLDEQASFAIEQIELAISGIEHDIENYNTLLAQMEDAALPFKSLVLENQKKEYLTLQNELNLLNTFASKIHSLRKEVLKTEIRVKYKSQIFKQLSHLGDKVFPKRKELIREISYKFFLDVDFFAKKYFAENSRFKMPYYRLKEEIKKLQNVSKAFTLNTKTFTSVRLKLSECWDKIKQLETEYKQEMEGKKELFEQNKQTVLEKIQSFAKKCAATEEISGHIVKRDEIDILNFMRSVELAPKDVKILKEEIKQAKSPIFAKEKEAEEKAKKIMEEKNKLRTVSIQELKTAIEKALSGSQDNNSQQLNEEYKEFISQIKKLQLTKIEKKPLEQILRQFKEMICDKKDQALLNLSEKDLASLSHLKETLKESEIRRAEIKQQLEHLRHAVSRSDLDFEKAISYREEIEKEKQRLEKINQVISKIEDNIVKLEES